MKALLLFLLLFNCKSQTFECVNDDNYENCMSAFDVDYCSSATRPDWVPIGDVWKITVKSLPHPIEVGHIEGDWTVCQEEICSAIESFASRCSIRGFCINSEGIKKGSGIWTHPKSRIVSIEENECDKISLEMKCKESLPPSDIKIRELRIFSIGMKPIQHHHLVPHVVEERIEHEEGSKMVFIILFVLLVFVLIGVCGGVYVFYSGRKVKRFDKQKLIKRKNCKGLIRPNFKKIREKKEREREKEREKDKKGGKKSKTKKEEIIEV